MRRQQLGSPTLVVVGDVVALRGQLNWFEDKPLFGRRILITRSREQSGSLQTLLEAEGAEVSSLPVLLIRPPSDWADVDAALDNADARILHPEFLEAIDEELRAIDTAYAEVELDWGFFENFIAFLTPAKD